MVGLFVRGYCGDTAFQRGASRKERSLSSLHQRFERRCVMLYFLRTAVQQGGGGTVTLATRPLRSKYKYNIIKSINKKRNSSNQNWSGSSYSVFKVGQVGVPPQADHVDVHDAELGGEVVEVDCLCQRPHTQVHLWMKTEFE